MDKNQELCSLITSKSPNGVIHHLQVSYLISTSTSELGRSGAKKKKI